MDISLKILIQFYLNNTLNSCPLSTQRISCYTHKMAIVSWTQIIWRHFTPGIQTLYESRPNFIHFDFSISIRDLRLKQMLFNSSSGFATVVMRRGKKSVVRVAQCIAALVPVHRTLSLLSDVHCFLNPSGTSIRLPIQDYCRIWPVDYMVLVACMISQSWFALFWQTG